MRIFLSVMAFSTLVGPALAEDHEVSQRNRAFSPETLEIRVGDRVTFKNDDVTPHHIKVKSGPKKFASRLLPRGLNYAVPFDEEGRWSIGCRIHPRMHMTVDVRPAAANPAQSDD